MNEKLEQYIHEITSTLTCSPQEKQEIADEMRDHLYTSYEGLLANGHEEKSATNKAIQTFGQTNVLKLSFQQVVDPLYGWLHKFALIGFILYSFALSWILLIKRLITRIIDYQSFDFLFNSYVKTQGTLATEKAFFDFSIWEHNVNFIPFKTIVLYLKAEHMNTSIAVNNLVGNFSLLLPLGLLLPFLFKRCKRFTSVVAIAFITSFCIEIIQFALQVGMADIDDVILNILGAMFGFTIYKLIMWFLSLRIQFKHKKYSTS
ncbi:VanZ family protein [Viridibacillus sp. NPDC096237]|uniref:VanZ family protein n=1 Tax=Viridibacillus sp. NPDC096237 TaxID=3390721 RepID=UPI003CFD95D0